MTAPSYTEDLADIDLATAITNWAESTDAAWALGGAPTADGDYPYIQGSMAISQTATKTGLVSLLVNNGSGITVPTDGAVFVWQNFSSPPAIDNYATGGLRVMIGSGLGAFYSWDVGGNDFGRNPYGGWQNHAVNPTVSVDDTVGVPSGTQQYIGAAAKIITGIGKGNPHQVDAVRYGRGSSIFEYGDLANGYCTFAGFATQNDNSTYRWGLIQAIDGGYLYKGKMTLGTTSNAVDFRDSNVSVLIDATPKVTASFNTIEVNNASTRVDWTNVKFTALGTASPGRLLCNVNADLNWDRCQFTGMGAFTFGGTASTCTNAIWKSCGLVTGAGGTFNGSSVLTSTVAADASAFNWNVVTDPDGYLDDMTFSKGTNAHHAIEFGTSSPTSITLRGWIATGFNTSNGQNDSTFYVARTVGTVTISVVGGSGNFTYKSAGATVFVIVDPVTTQVTCLDADTMGAIEGVAVTLIAAGTGAYPYNASVTITRVGSTAYVAHAGHGLTTGDKVKIAGAVQNEYNRIKTITVTGVDEYTYPVSGTPTTPATGTITATMVFIDEDTPASGIVSDSRVFSSSQAVAGFAAKGTSSPLYKRVPLSGTIDSVEGLSLTAVMFSDE